MRRRPRCIISLTVVACFLLTSCASNQMTAHIEATQSDPEHDEVETSDAVMKFYPNRKYPDETFVRVKTGGMMWLSCDPSPCTTQMKMKAVGLEGLADGTYLVIKTDDPDFSLIKNEDGTQTVGYVSTNHYGRDGFFPTFDKAKDHENEGRSLAIAGKAAVFSLKALLLVGVVALYVAVAAAGAY